MTMSLYTNLINVSFDNSLKIMNDHVFYKVSIQVLGTVALRASVHHLAVLTLYETVNVNFTTQP